MLTVNAQATATLKKISSFFLKYLGSGCRAQTIFLVVVASLFIALYGQPADASPLTFNVFHDPYGSPQNTIGLVKGVRERNSSRDTLGTAVMVRPQIAVSAGHVIYNPHEGWLINSFYVPQNISGKGFAPANWSNRREIALLRLMRGYRTNASTNNLTSYSRDLGTITFKRRQGLPFSNMYTADTNNWVLPLLLDPDKADTRLRNNLEGRFRRTIYGYSPGRYWMWDNNRLAMHSSGPFGDPFSLSGPEFDQQWANAWYKIPSRQGYQGMSGSPLFAHFSNGEKKVAGIVITSTANPPTIGIRAFDTKALIMVIHAKMAWDRLRKKVTQ